MLNYLYFFLYLALTAPLRADLVTLPLTGKTQILEMKKQTLKEISEEKQQELVQPILEAIQNANKSIIGCVYKMDYPLLVNALCAATKKIPVTLFVEKSPYQHEGSDRAQTNIDFLQKNGITVLTEINGYPQAQLHTKFLVIDDKVAFFSTQNGIQNLL